MYLLTRRLVVHKEECDDISVNTPERTFCEIAHYSIEYGAPASLGDLAYEIGKTPRTEPCIVGAVNRGTEIAKRHLPALLNRGLVKKTQYGGYVLTAKGRTEFGKLASRYGIKLHRSEVV